MQAVNALSCVYFLEGGLDEQALSDLVSTRKYHPSIYKKQALLGAIIDEPDGTNGQFIIHTNAQLRLDAKLSFVRTIDGHSYEDYEGASVPPRSWEPLKLAEKWGKILEQKVLDDRVKKAVGKGDEAEYETGANVRSEDPE